MSAFDSGVSWVGVVPSSKPTSFQVASILAGEPVVLAVFETHPETGNLLDYGPIVTDRATDHDAVQDWISLQTESLKVLTTLRRP